MLFPLKYLLHVLVLPPAILLLAAGLGLVLARRRPRLGRGLIAGALGVLWLLSMPPVARHLEQAVEPYPALSLEEPVPGAGAVVILGGGVNARAAEYGGVPSPTGATLARVVYGARVARRLGLPVLVTGAPAEARAMRTMLEEDFAIRPRWIDDSASDTYDNARHSARLLAADRIACVVLVTSANHLARAAHEFEAAGLRVVPAPTAAAAPPNGVPDELPYALLPTADALLKSEQALREVVGELARPAMGVLHRRVGDG